jgi:POT family proton-dependent oligopeptide transporter
MANAVARYFSEFKVLKSASRDFWLTNAIQFLDGLAYFPIITALSLYLTANCGFDDVQSGAWVGIFTLYITAFAFAVGSICDVIGVKKAYCFGIGLLAISRFGLGFTPMFTSGATMGYTVRSFIILMSLGTAFMTPVTMTALRRYTSKETRGTGFNIYYLLMNVGSFLSFILVLDGLRTGFTIPGTGIAIGGGPDGRDGNLAIFIFAGVMALLSLVCVFWLREHNYAEPSERLQEGDSRRPLAIFMEVWKEKPFQRLILFLVLTIGVRLVFTHQFLVMPKYYIRVMDSDFNIGWVNSINPLIIVIGLIVLIPIINRYSTIKLIIIGMIISAASLVFLILPVEWFLKLPFIDSHAHAYFFMIVAQIIVFAIGELIFNPRFTEYIASVSPPDKVSSYMALSALPAFISKPINGFISGILISRFCYDGIRPKIETGNVGYLQSPEFMWLIYFALAALSPVAVIAMKNRLTRGDKPAATAES